MNRFLVSLLGFVCLLCLNSCSRQQNQSSGLLRVSGTTSAHNNAILCIDTLIDFGVFTRDEYRKEFEIHYSNSGDDTLRLYSWYPECDCTEVLSVDSVLPPHENGLMTIALDLSEYPRDTIYKVVNIISNDLDHHVTAVTLFGFNNR